MKIISLTIKNHFYGWWFDDIRLSSNLNLLVGISGAGKTQILNSIAQLKKIVNGETNHINGFEWKIIFALNEVFTRTLLYTTTTITNNQRT